ncbi:hypothetical protein DRH14_03575 [Candidatus Shapirobacteria bacterium]|nr:MAG: hypothetical protein DRH14_03575 [Candidatus Shapirobacteria bacterium]
MNITWFYADRDGAEWNSSRWRVLWPHRALQRAGIASRIASLPQECELPVPHPLMTWADVVVIERVNVYPPQHPRMRQVQKHVEWALSHKRTFLTIDDAYHLMPSSSPSKVVWNKHALDTFRDYARSSQGVFCPSLKLSRDAICGSKGIYIPNYPDLHDVPPPVSQHAPEQTVIGWGATQQHTRSFTVVARALREVLQRRSDVQVWMITSPSIFASAKLPSYRSRLLHWRRPYRSYMQFIGNHFTVGLAPLFGGYDQRRSWIKPLEYALMGIPWVASNTLEYRKVKGGQVVGKHGDWAQAILKALESPRGEAVAWARHQGIDEHIKEYMEVLGCD